MRLRIGCMCALLCAPLCDLRAQQAAEPRPNQILRGTVTGRDLHTYKMLPFDVPPGTRRITVLFSQTGRAEKTVIDLGLFDPERFRGWSGSNKNWFTVSEVDATSSYLPGPLPPGTWHLLLGIPNIRSGAQAEYKAEVYLSASVEPPDFNPVRCPVLRSGPAWYQGDLHAHTAQSDGTCTSMSGRNVPCPEFKLMEAAAARGLDFIAVTDHNTTSTYNSLLRWQDYFDNLLLIRGREITTFVGHANVYGSSEWIDFRLGPELTANAIADQTHRQGGIISINHPAAPSGEVCMGCRWTAEPALDDARLDAVEVVNGPEAESAFSGIPFWEDRLRRGRRVTAIGGSDDHESGTRAASGRPVGRPTTVVYARELSELAILDGIRAGHVFLKPQGPVGPDVFLAAASGDQKAMVGDNLRIGNGDRLQFQIQVVGGKDDRVELIRDGRPKTIDNSAVRSLNQTIRFEVAGDGGRHWYRVNLRGSDGALLAITNPIYENFPDSLTK